MMNMSVHGDGSVGIYSANSLTKEEHKFVLKPEGFFAVLTNPPFSLEVKKGSVIDIDGVDVLEKYELSHTHRYDHKKNQFEWKMSGKTVRNQDSKVLFLERCHELVKKEKLVCIVVDDGVANNPSYDYVRDFIFRKYIVKAVIALPFGVFKERGAENYTSILFLQRKTEGMIQGDIFMSMPEHAGELFGKTGQRLRNDLEDVLKEYKDYVQGKQKSFKFSFICKKHELEDYYEIGGKYRSERGYYKNRLDPKFYCPRHKKIVDKIEKSGVAQKIGQVVDFVEEIYPKENINEFGSKYILCITNTGEIEHGVFDGTRDPKGLKDHVFRTGDLVASRINIKNGMIAIIPPELDDIRGTFEYYKLVPKTDEEGKPKVLKEYLYIILTSEPIRFLMEARSSGQYRRLRESELAKIKIPVPDIDTQKSIIARFKQAQEKLSKLKKQTKTTEDELNKQIEKIILESLFALPVS